MLVGGRGGNANNAGSVEGFKDGALVGDHDGGAVETTKGDPVGTHSLLVRGMECSTTQTSDPVVGGFVETLSAMLELYQWGDFVGAPVGLLATSG
jgi:hypothetical protein